MATMAGLGPGHSQEFGIPYGLPTWLAGALVCGPSNLLSQDQW